MTPPKSQPRGPQARSLKTRAALLDAAQAIASEAGLGALRTDEVVRRVGVAKGTFFAHFPDKDHLLAELVARRLIYRPAGGDWQAFVSSVEGLMRIMAAEPEVLPVLVRFSGAEGAGLELLKTLCALSTAIAEDLAVLQGKGQVRAAPVPLLAEGVIAFVFHAAGSANCPGNGEERAELLEAASTTLRALCETLLRP